MCRCSPEIRAPFCGRLNCVWPEDALEKLSQIEGYKKEVGMQFFTHDENLIMRDLILREITRHIESDVGFMKLYTPIYLAIVRKLEGVKYE